MQTISNRCSGPLNIFRLLGLKGPRNLFEIKKCYNQFKMLKGLEHPFEIERVHCIYIASDFRYILSLFIDILVFFGYLKHNNSCFPYVYNTKIRNTL